VAGWNDLTVFFNVQLFRQIDMTKGTLAQLGCNSEMIRPDKFFFPALQLFLLFRFHFLLIKLFSGLPQADILLFPSH